jgi:hypothetical protein
MLLTPHQKCSISPFSHNFLFVPTLLPSFLTLSISLCSASHCLCISNTRLHVEVMGDLLCYQVVNTSASYSEGPVFKYRPRYRLFSQGFVLFLSTSGESRDRALKLGHDRFLPHPFQFNIFVSSFQSTPYESEILKNGHPMNNK